MPIINVIRDHALQVCMQSMIPPKQERKKRTQEKNILDRFLIILWRVTYRQSHKIEPSIIFVDIAVCCMATRKFSLM